MPRPRTPLRKARLTGADRNHPERYRGRGEPALSGRGIGTPPAYLPEAAKAAWREFRDELGWLAHEDRAVLEAASLARARLREAAGAGELTGALFAANRALLASLGATPADRSRVTPPAKDAPDPFERFQ